MAETVEQRIAVCNLCEATCGLLLTIDRGRVTGARGGRPELSDGTVLDVGTVVWCTGFRQVFDWIDLPVFDGRGRPSM